MMTGDLGYPFVQARWYTAANRAAGSVKWIVLHAMQAPERLSTAEGTANYFAGTSVKASAHFSCDADSTVQSVRLSDVAYGAPGANAAGVHIEQAGYSEQNVDGWADEYSQRMLREQVAPLVAKLANYHSIPIKYVDAAALKRGERGVTTHKQCSDAFGGTHWDPGVSYPIDELLIYARSHSTGTATPVPQPGTITPTPLPIFPAQGGNKMILTNGSKRWLFWSTTDGRLLHKYWDGTAWSGTYPLLKGVAPLAQVQADWLGDSWHVYCALGDGHLGHAWWAGTGVGSESL